MKNVTLIFISFLLIQNLIAQEKSVVITSDGFEININFPPVEYLVYNEGNYKKFDFVFNEDESKPGYPKLPSKIYFIAIPPKSKVKIELIDKKYDEIQNALIETNKKPKLVDDSLIVYETISLEKNSQFENYDHYPENEIEVLDYIWLRDFYCAVIRVNTHTYFFDTKTLRILETAKLKVRIDNQTVFAKNSTPDTFFEDILERTILNFKEAKDFKSFNPDIVNNDTTGNWIDYTKEYVKLAIPEDNVYRITYSDLVNYGLNPSLINPQTIKIFRLGREVPIYVKGEEDIQFNEDDYIEFFGEKNYTYQDYRQIVNWGQDYIHYMNRYTDTSFYWLTYGGNNGRRISFINTIPFSTPDTISSHLVKMHFEKDMRLWYYDAVEPRVQLPQWQENKVFTWLVIGNSGSQSINFQARDFLPNTKVKIIARLISNASNAVTNAHKNGLSLNSTTPQDTITYNFRQTVNLQGNYSSNQLNTGNNIIRIFGIPSQASFHQSLIDWVDLEYYRRNFLVNDTLLITIPDTVTKDLRVIRVENITASDTALLIYKVHPDFKRIIAYSSVGSNPRTIFFIDSVKGGDKYFITRIEKTRKPIFKTKKQFVNLRNTSRGADYIILTNSIFANSTNIYKQFISQTYNLRVERINVEDVFDEFAFGQPEAEAIRTFLKFAYSNWVQPRPSYLTIIGDANYDYKDVVTPAPAVRKKNFVTSYGNPVSDPWYVMFDAVNQYFPQMFVGRIPANSDQEVLFYLQKHQQYLSRNFDEFNKTFLFFSGGDPASPSQLDQIKSTNDYLINNFVSASPYYGKFNHFYKTSNPPTNFGPYTPEQVQRAIDEGALYISYIGHSGTTTWDNGISDVLHLRNKYQNRFPLITDFGCSTGKFAEPDVKAFGEDFICQSNYGQALVYLGNSSWGYLSTSLRFPRLFYEILTKDSLKGIGRAHLLAKIRQMNETGFSTVNQVFTYCNTYLGDPVVGAQFPPKPNLYIDEAKFKLLTANPNDQMDSIDLKIIISNYGKYVDDTMKILIKDFYRDTVNFQLILYTQIPKFFDTLSIRIPVKELAGEHKIKVDLDTENSIDEIYETDNSAQFTFVVNSTNLLAIENDSYFNSGKEEIYFLNPFERRSNLPERLYLQISDSANFSTFREILKDFDSIITKIDLINLLPNKRYYYRLKIDHPSAYFSPIFSFKQIYNGAQFYLNEEGDNSERFYYQNVVFNKDQKQFELDSMKVNLKIISAGGHDGAFGSIQYNQEEKLPNTYYWGLATALIDSVTLQPHSFRYFLVPEPGATDSLINYINRLPNGTLIAMTISADAVQNILGWASSPARNAIKTLGSLYIDSVQYREGWAILGKKGAPIGSVPEAYKKLFDGLAIVEVNKSMIFDSGYVIFPQIKNSSKWKYVKIESEKPSGTNLILTPIGISSIGIADTLYELSTSQDSLSLENISTEQYAGLQIISKFYSNELKQSPKIKSLSAYFDELPELAVNYQSVKIDKDTIYQGESVNYIAKIYNAGKSSADTFRILLELVKPDNSSYVLLDTIINKIDPMQFTKLTYKYINKIYDGYGDFAFRLKIDPGNSIREFYKMNNTYIKSFYVKKDTTTSVSAAQVFLMINGKEIRDWEYVEPEGKIELKINYPIWFPVNDTSAVQIYLDGKRIYSESLTFDYDTIDRRINIQYQTKFEKGEHNLRVFLKDAFGRIPSQPTIDKYFKVTSNLELQNVYNYPNPFSNGTYFTFVLTQVPEEVQIKIYTIAGRLIKEFRLSQAELTTNFNKIFWDGRDEDGDLIGNGVYLYKVIAKKGEQVQTTIQKLAVVR
jgi:hypothetical protein